MFANLGWTEVLIVGFGVLFLLFGVKRLPEMGRNIGQSVHNLIRGLRGAFSEDTPTLPPSDRNGQHLSN